MARFSKALLTAEGKGSTSLDALASISTMPQITEEERNFESPILSSSTSSQPSSTTSPSPVETPTVVSPSTIKGCYCQMGSVVRALLILFGILSIAGGVGFWVYDQHIADESLFKSVKQDVSDFRHFRNGRAREFNVSGSTNPPSSSSPFPLTTTQEPQEFLTPKILLTTTMYATGAQTTTNIPGHQSTTTPPESTTFFVEGLTLDIFIWDSTPPTTTTLAETTPRTLDESFTVLATTAIPLTATTETTEARLKVESDSLSISTPMPLISPLYVPNIPTTIKNPSNFRDLNITVSIYDPINFYNNEGHVTIVPSSGHSNPDPLFTPKLNPPKINYPTIQTYTVGHNGGVKATSSVSSSSSIAFTKPSLIRPSRRPFEDSKPSIEIEELFHTFKRPSLEPSSNKPFIRPTSVFRTGSLERITTLSNGLIEVDGGIDEVKFDRVSAEPTAEALETFKVLPGNQGSEATETIVGSTTISNNFFADDEGNVKATGLVTVERGTAVENGITTVHTSRVFGTSVDGQYAQIIQSTSKVFKDDVQATPGPEEGLSTGNVEQIDESQSSRPYGGRRSSRLFHLKNSKRKMMKKKRKLLLPQKLLHKNADSREDRSSRFGGIKNKKEKKTETSSRPSSYKRSHFSSGRHKLRNRGGTTIPPTTTQSSEDLQAQPSSTREVSVEKNSYSTRKRIRPNRFRNRFSSKFGKNKKETTTTTPNTTTTTTTTTTESYKRKSSYKSNRKSLQVEDKTSPLGIKKFNRFNRPNLRKSLLSKILGKNGGKVENYANQDGSDGPEGEEIPTEKQDQEVETYEEEEKKNEYESSAKLSEDIYDDDVFVGDELEEEEYSYEEEPKSLSSFKREKDANLYEKEEEISPIDSNSIYPSDPLQTTLKVSTEYPEDSAYLLQVATIRSPYSFDIDDDSSPLPNRNPSLHLRTSLLPPFLLQYFHLFSHLDGSLETLPAVTYHLAATNGPTPPLKTVTETYSTTELMLKTSILPIIIDGSTKYHSLVQSYFVTRMVEAVKTLPPMEAYEFIPTKAFTDFSNVLDEAGSEKREHLLPGELEFSDQDQYSLEGPQEVRVRPPPGFKDDLKLIGSKFDPVESMEKKNNPEISQLKNDDEPTLKQPSHPLQSSISQNPFGVNPFNPFGLPQANPTSATPGLSSFNPLGSFTPDQLRQLALFQYFNNPFNLAGYGAFNQQAQPRPPQPQPKPIIKTETIYETNTIPIILGNKQIFTTLTRAVGVTTLTEYEKSEQQATALPPSPPAIGNPILNPFQQPQANVGFTVTSSAVIQETTVPSLVTKELRIIFRNTPTVTTLTSSTMVATQVTSYVTKTVPIGGGATLNPLAAFLG
ncbi:unnamed protein product [Lepeophtheirus salmonis]|uniref:(salmon louse) hypothetical protein n=1 Tax=Lepeophtheirus salmonis TaxID=72036 RepID=A0A7R8D1D0_LEPSM|nr:unnamed protein product [Lepeophtheirus salmonis]CAF2988683.1 unnamed protein product [Lepeophtheirus salmonis]